MTSTALRPHGQKYVRGTADSVYFFFTSTKYTAYLPFRFAVCVALSNEPWYLRASINPTYRRRWAMLYVCHTRATWLYCYTRDTFAYTHQLFIAQSLRTPTICELPILLCGLQGDFHTQITLREGREALKHYLPMRPRQVRVKIHAAGGVWMCVYINA